MKGRFLSTVGAALASVSLLLTAVTIPADSTALSPTALRSQCSIGNLAQVMDVYLAVPTARATPMPFPIGVRSYLSTILMHRLRACSNLLAAKGTAYACAPRGSEMSDVRSLWTHLNFCVSLANPPQPQQSAVLWQVPGAFGLQPVIFVMGSVADPTENTIASKMISTLTVFLNAGRDEAGYRFVDNAVLVPEPAWNLDRFEAECAASLSVRGAIVADITAAGSGSSDDFVTRRNWAAIEANASYVQCTHKTPHGIAAVNWVSGIEQQNTRRSVITPLVPLATLFSLVGMYQVFVPSRSTTITDTRVYRTPNPVPPGGATTSVATQTSTSLNSNNPFGSIAGGFLGSSITYTNAAVPLTTTALDQQTWDAVESLAMKLISDMNCWQPSPQAIGTPPASDVTGAQRPLPAYNPPAGLIGGQYNAFGKPSAPFCAEPGIGQPASHASIRILMPGTPMPISTQPPRRPHHA